MLILDECSWPHSVSNCRKELEWDVSCGGDWGDVRVQDFANGPDFPHKLKQNNGAKDGSIPDKTFKCLWHMFPGELNHLNSKVRLGSLFISPVNSAPPGCQLKSLWGKRWGLELRTESCIAFNRHLGCSSGGARVYEERGGV